MSQKSTMKEAIVDKDTKVTIHNVSLPSPGPNEILIKVVVSGSNPKDWKYPIWDPKLSGTNTGDDIAGYVHQLGSDVTSFAVGQRVAAFHIMRTPHGSFAEYAIAPAYTTFHLPKNVGFEEGATIPLAAMTGAVGLFVRLGLPEKWQTSDNTLKSPGPILIYGAATAVGAYAIQLAGWAGIHPLICIAGKGGDFVKKLNGFDESKGDIVLDYRQGDEKLVSSIKSAVKGEELRYAFDCVSEKGSHTNIINSGLSAKGGKYTGVLPLPESDGFPTGIQKSLTMVGCVHDDQKDFGTAWFHLFSRGLAEGWFKPHPATVVPGGLGGVQTGLQNLKNGKASAEKYVFKIADTQGASF